MPRDYVVLWEVWPGRNVICCGGRTMAGPKEDICTLMTGWTLVIISLVLFYISASGNSIHPFVLDCGLSFFFRQV